MLVLICRRCSSALWALISKKLVKALILSSISLGVAWVIWGTLTVGSAPSRASMLNIRMSTRPTQGRIFGMSYSPYNPGVPPIGRKDLRRQVKSDLNSVDFALVGLLAGRLQDATRHLEKVRRLPSVEPWVHNDLSALYLESAKRGGDTYDLVNALAESMRVDPVSLEARFNQALALEGLFLRNQARLAWKNYLELDPDSDWAEESRKRLRELTRLEEQLLPGAEEHLLSSACRRGDLATVRLVTLRSPQVAREYAEEHLLGEWAVAYLQQSQQEADRVLFTVRQVSELIVQKNRDRMLWESAFTINRAIERDQEQATSLARGHVRYGEGLSAYARSDFGAARKLFFEASRLLTQGGSPYALWAQLRVAICEIQQFGYDHALSSLDDLATDAAREGYLSLSGATLWSIGLIYSIRARPAEALVFYRAAELCSERLGDTDNLAAIKSLIASCYLSLGDRSVAWKYQYEALQLIPRTREPRRRAVIFDEAGSILLDSGQPDAAIPFQDEALGEIEKVRQPAWLVAGLRKKALLYEEAGRSSEARNVISEARRYLSALSDADARASLDADLLAVEAQIVSKLDLGEGIALISMALDSYNGTGYELQIVDLLVRRATAYMALGQLDHAREDLMQAINFITEQRGRLTEISLRESFLDRVRSVFDTMVELQIRLGHSRDALAYAERARAQTLREFLIERYGGASAIGSIKDIQKSLVEGETLIEYSVLRDNVYAWLIQRDTLRSFRLNVSTVSLQRLVESLCYAAAKNDISLFRQRSEVLRKALVEPITTYLRRGERLVFVPDGPLYFVPFAGLWNSSTKRYLIEDFPVLVAPSALIYAMGKNRRARQTWPGGASILAIGDPSFDRRLWPSLTPLPEAKIEVEAVVALYPNHKVLVGDAATVSALLSAIGEFDILHIAAHVIVNQEQALSSALLLSPSGMPGNTGILYARDLTDIQFPKTSLVVLSACGSLNGKLGRTEGLSSLARPFLAGGVSNVVGTLWWVEDQGARAFSVRFHEKLRNGFDPVDALRLSQVESIAANQAGLSPAVWAAFVILG